MTSQAPQVALVGLAAWQRTRFLVLGFGTSVIKFNKEEGRGSQGWRVQLLLVTNKGPKETKQLLLDSLPSPTPSEHTQIMLSLLGNQSLSRPPRLAGWLYLVSPQSLELETGVSHHSLDLFITACLLTRSPAAAFAFPRPPRHNIYIYIYIFFFFFAD